MNDAAPEQRRQVARCGGTALSRGSKRHTADRAEGPRPVGFWKESATDQNQRYDAEKISSLNPRRSSERPGVEFFSPFPPDASNLHFRSVRLRTLFPEAR